MKARIIGLRMKKVFRFGDCPSENKTLSASSPARTARFHVLAYAAMSACGPGSVFLATKSLPCDFNRRDVTEGVPEG